MARTTYQRYTITELRRWARDLKIPGRSKMDGYELVVACKMAARAAVIEAEQAVLNAVHVEPGVMLRHKSTGDVVRVTSTPHEYVRDGIGYQSLSFTAEYVTVGTPQPGEVGEGAAAAEHRNRMDALSAQSGYTLEHMLYQYEAV